MVQFLNKPLTPLRVLVIEDSESDTLLVLREIRKGGYEPVSARVETADELKDALARRQWDVIISDFSMPQFDGLSALDIVRKSALDIPFILVSGTLTEENAVNSLRAGAHDFLTKFNLARLAPAIDRELKESVLRRERKRLQKELEAYHASLEKKVEERTAALSAANEALVREITERKRAEEALRESEARFREAFIHVPVGMALNDPQGRFLYVNESYCRIVGYSPEELLHPDLDYKKLTHPDDLDNNVRLMDRMFAGEIPSFFLEKRYIRKDGAVVWVRVSATARRDSAGRPVHTVSLVEDISERRRLAEEIKHMAHHDALTGLPNRRLFTDILKVKLALARRYKSKLAVLFLDLDRFKDVNDTLGHETGDELLKEVARRFRKTIRESDTVARIGGDEFNIVMADLYRAEDIADIVRKIAHALKRPLLCSGTEIIITTSIGISIYPDDSEDLEVLRKYADIAMYHAKRSGRNTYQFYNPAINVRSLEQIRFENMLRRSIDAGDFAVFYQPQIDIRNKRIVSAEALLRWHHPEQGFLTSEKFLPLAEEMGFMPQIDDWALRTVCRQMRVWIDAGLPPIFVTVNLSSRRFQSLDLVSTISSVLAETHTPPGCLDIEVTESLAMNDVERSLPQLRQLRGMGVHISIDDFGTGYSSLNYLKKLPVERLKIDKSFVRDIASNAEDREIVSAVISMARKMGIRTVAEGIETREQLDFVREAGCDEAQGFLFSMPVTAHEFEALLVR